jgi:PAS domain S-box-containing protein
VAYLQANDAAASPLFIAPRIEALVGYTPAEWLADHDIWLRLVHPDDRERVEAEHLRTNASGERFSMEYRMLARDGAGRLGP